MQSEAGGTILFIVGGLVVVGLIVVVIVAEQRRIAARRQMLAAWAASLGFEYRQDGLDPQRDGGFWSALLAIGSSEESRFIDLFEQFQPFGLGHSQTVDNLITGARGEVHWYLFDYTYKITRSTGKSTSTTTYPNTVVAVRVPMALPPLTLSAESFLNRIGEVFGRREVRFESDEFNRKYFVQCPDAKSAYDLIHPTMIEYLLEQPTMTWQMAGPFLMLYVTRYASVEEMAHMMGMIEGFLDRIPDYMREDLGFSAPWVHPLDQMTGPEDAR